MTIFGNINEVIRALELMQEEANNVGTTSMYEYSLWCRL